MTFITVTIIIVIVIVTDIVSKLMSVIVSGRNAASSADGASVLLSSRPRMFLIATITFLVDSTINIVIRIIIIIIIIIINYEFKFILSRDVRTASAF